MEILVLYGIPFGSGQIEHHPIKNLLHSLPLMNHLKKLHLGCFGLELWGTKDVLKRCEEAKMQLVELDLSNNISLKSFQHFDARNTAPANETLATSVKGLDKHAFGSILFPYFPNTLCLKRLSSRSVACGVQ